MIKYQIFRFQPKGDDGEAQEKRLIKLLEEGWQIISSAGTDYGLIVYVLKYVQIK